MMVFHVFFSIMIILSYNFTLLWLFCYTYIGGFEDINTCLPPWIYYPKTWSVTFSELGMMYVLDKMSRSAVEFKSTLIQSYETEAILNKKQSKESRRSTINED